MTLAQRQQNFSFHYGYTLFLLVFHWWDIESLPPVSVITFVQTNLNILEQKRGNKLADAGSKMVAGTGIVSMMILSLDVNSVRKAGLTIQVFVTRDRETCPLSVLTSVRNKRVILKEMYELFVGTNKTVRNIGVSVLNGYPQSEVALYYHVDLPRNTRCRTETCIRELQMKTKHQLARHSALLFSEMSPVSRNGLL